MPLQLDYEESLRKQQREGSESGSEQEDGPGKLRLVSKIDLNSMDVDLSAQLRPRKKPAAAAAAVSKAAARPAAGSRGAGAGATRPRAGTNPPTRLEQKGWERSGKFSRKVRWGGRANGRWGA